MIGFELCFFFKILMLKKFCEREVAVESAVEFTVEGIFQHTNENLHDFFFQNAAVAFSALVQALDELNVVAIVRYAYDRRCNPQIGVAFPCIKDTYEVTFHLYLFLEIL